MPVSEPNLGESTNVRQMARRLKRKARWLLTVCLATSLFCYYRYWQMRRENSQDDVILAAAARYGVDAALIKAVVWRESWFNPFAVGKAGEIGLMQVSDLAAHEWADSEGITFFVSSQLFDPAKNVQAGTWYLRKAIRRYDQADDPIPYALADYNAGRANVLRWLSGAASTNSKAFIDQIGFPTTKHYVTSVMKRYEHYKPIFPPNPK